MTAVYPKVSAFLKKNAVNNRPGMAGKIALIGAFDTEETTPVLYIDLDEAQTKLGTDKTFNGCKVLPILFKGASSILAVNYTTKSESAVDKTLTTEKLAACLKKIKGEDWDILFVSEILTDAFITVINEFLDDTWEMKMPAGYFGALNGQNATANVASAQKAGEHCYGLITQTLQVNGEDYDLLQSIAHYASVISSMNVGNTMTMKTVTGVTGISPEYTFETGDTGITYLEAGITTFKCANRNDGRYVVVNSEQPNGYDLYINRVRDFVVKEFALHDFLGERNRQATLSEIEHMLASVKQRCVNDLDLLEDIQYRVVRKNANCVDVYIDSLLFAGIITQINVYVTIEVE